MAEKRSLVATLLGLVGKPVAIETSEGSVARGVLSRVQWRETPICGDTYKSPEALVLDDGDQPVAWAYVRSVLRTDRPLAEQQVGDQDEGQA